MNVRFRVLGPAEVYVDGQPVPIQGGRLLTVLAGLLLRANHAVSIEQLPQVQPLGQQLRGRCQITGLGRPCRSTSAGCAG